MAAGDVVQLTISVEIALRKAPHGRGEDPGQTRPKKNDQFQETVTKSSEKALAVHRHRQLRIKRVMPQNL